MKTIRILLTAAFLFTLVITQAQPKGVPFSQANPISLYQTIIPYDKLVDCSEDAGRPLYMYFYPVTPTGIEQSQNKIRYILRENDLNFFQPTRYLDSMPKDILFETDYERISEAVHAGMGYFQQRLWEMEDGWTFYWTLDGESNILSIDFDNITQKNNSEEQVPEEEPIYLTDQQLLMAIRDTINSYSPQNVGQGLILRNTAVFPGKVLAFNYNFMDLTVDELRASNFKFTDEYKAQLINSIRSNQQLTPLREKGVTFQYRFHDREMTFFEKITISPSDYK